MEVLRRPKDKKGRGGGVRQCILHCSIRHKHESEEKDRREREREREREHGSFEQFLGMQWLPWPKNGSNEP